MNKKAVGDNLSYGILLVCLALIGGCVILNISLIYGFGAGITLLIFFFRIKGFSMKDLGLMMWKGLYECRLLYALIMLIGATVSIWLSSGVVPAMIYYGFKYTAGMNFIFAAFMIIAISSIFMGTAIGTVSTIGIAVLGIGRGYGIPDNVLLGVVVSGAFIADKISPISGLINLTLKTTNTDYKGIFKSMIKTLIPAVIITAFVYYVFGIKYGTGGDPMNILRLQQAIQEEFFLSPILLLMPLIIVFISFMGLKILYSILIGLSGGALISVLLQGVTFNELLRSILFGYKGATASQSLNEILISGGVLSMWEVLLIVGGAVSLSSILEGTGLIKEITDKFIKKISAPGELIIKTGIISSILTVVTCDQTMGIVLPGRFLKDKYDELGISRTVLVRTISDTGTIIAPLMPWNINALLIGLITGMGSGYIPYAVLCYTAPLLTVILAAAVQLKNSEKREVHINQQVSDAEF